MTDIVYRLTRTGRTDCFFKNLDDAETALYIIKCRNSNEEDDSARIVQEKVYTSMDAWNSDRVASGARGGRAELELPELSSIKGLRNDPNSVICDLDKLLHWETTIHAGKVKKRDNADAVFLYRLIDNKNILFNTSESYQFTKLDEDQIEVDFGHVTHFKRLESIYLCKTNPSNKRIFNIKGAVIFQDLAGRDPIISGCLPSKGTIRLMFTLVHRNKLAVYKLKQALVLDSETQSAETQNAETQNAETQNAET